MKGRRGDGGMTRGRDEGVGCSRLRVPASSCLRVSLLLLLLSLPLGAEADTVDLIWEYDVTLQQEVTFVAHMTLVVGGQAVARDQVLPLTWSLVQGQRSTCAQVPGITLTPTTMCATLCLDGPGPVEVEVRAIRGTETSDASNPASGDLPGLSPCHPVPPPPPPKKPPYKDRLPPNIPPPPIPLPAMTPTLNLVQALNRNCVSWRITGACVCGFPPHPCLTVEYFEPAYLVETVKRPGTTMIPGASQLLQQALGSLGLWGGAGAGGGGGPAQSHTNLHYTEVHVWPFPQILGGPCTSCAPSTRPLALHYASELDAVSWRTTNAPVTLLPALWPVGTWGNTYPRTGKVIHGVESVASALATVRGLDIAQLPVGLPPNVDAHIVPVPISGMPTQTACLQMAYPRQLPCIQAGTPPATWEQGTIDPRGNYGWIIWVKRSCCVEINETTCGITLPGVGGQGANFCPLSPPSP